MYETRAGRFPFNARALQVLGIDVAFADRMLWNFGTEQSKILTSKLFISFDQPVAVGTMTVRADKPLTRYEVKEFNNRFAIIHFGEPLAECNLGIEVRP